MTYDHSRPIANLFKAINKYYNMAEANGATETLVMLINIGLIVLTRASIFANGVRIWQALLDDQKSWPNIKKHFLTAQRAIKQIQHTITTENLGYHQSANAAAIIYEVVSRITTPSSDEDSQLSTPTSPLQAAEQKSEQQTQQQLAIIASSSNQNQTMMAQMQTLMYTITDIQSQVNQRHNHRGGGSNDCRSGGGNESGGGKKHRSIDSSHHHRERQEGGRGGRGCPQLPQKYCHTHG